MFFLASEAPLGIMGHVKACCATEQAKGICPPEIYNWEERGTDEVTCCMTKELSRRRGVLFRWN